MNRSGHWGLAMLWYSPVVFGALSADLTTIPLVALGTLIISAFCMLPDVDQRIPLIKHRGITHTIWFALLVGGILGGGAFLLAQTAGQSILAQWIPADRVWGSPLPIALGGFFGVTGLIVIISHLFGDWMTKMGIRPYRPIWSHKHRLGITRADSWLANGALYVIGVGAIIFSYAAGTGVFPVN